MLNKCLTRYRSQSYISSSYNYVIYTIQQNIERTIKDLVCIQHEQMQITVLCLSPYCEKERRLICCKCLINRTHDNHEVVIVQDLMRDKKEMNRLISFLRKFKNKEFDDWDGSLLVEWMYDCFINGKCKQNYPEYQIEELLSTIQKDLMLNIDDLKSHYDCSLKTSPVYQKQKVVRFKEEMNQIIRSSHLIIQQKFSEIFSNQDSFERKSTNSQVQIQQFEQSRMEEGQQLNFSAILHEFPQQSIDEDVEVDEQQQQQFMRPCFQFVMSRGAGGYWQKRRSVEYSLGGKVVTLQKDQEVISDIPFMGENVEIRMRMVSFVKECIHLGVIESTTLEMTSDHESSGVWGCLSQECKCKPKMQRETGGNLRIGEGVISILLNFKQDLVKILYDNNLLYSKVGWMMNQKHHVFIRSYQKVTFELLN